MIITTLGDGGMRNVLACSSSRGAGSGKGKSSSLLVGSWYIMTISEKSSNMLIKNEINTKGMRGKSDSLWRTRNDSPNYVNICDTN